VDPIKVNKKNISAVEKDTLKRVMKTISALEVAMASWDLAKEKPADMEERLLKYKRFHLALTRWSKKMMVTNKDDYERRVLWLVEFVQICRTYS
jgi:hypothetical protein